MFLGTHTPKLDEKGRFFLPAKFRDELDDGLVITRGQDRCLAIYPTPDKQGRVMIPPMLRRYAGLNKEIVVVGAITRVEVWDATEWEKYSETQEEAFADMNEEVFAEQ